ncbi:MAG: hypothetical protein RIQ79_1872 [Verrucomicrobiota bacterium]
MFTHLLNSLRFVAFGFLCVNTALHAQLVVGWNFNNQSLAPEHGTGALTTAGLGTSMFLPVGSSQNLVSGDQAGDALVFAVTNLNNAGSLRLQLSTAGRESPVLSYAIGSTTDGFSSIQWAWSTDDVNYTDFSSALAVPIFVDTTEVTQMQVQTIDLTSVGGLAFQPDVYLRGTLDGATATLTASNLIMDNIQVSAAAIPEPAMAAVWCGSAALLGVLLLRKRRRRSAGAIAVGMVAWSFMGSPSTSMAASASDTPLLEIEATHRVIQRGGRTFQFDHVLINKGPEAARFDLAVVAVGDAGKLIDDLRLLVRGADGEWQSLPGLSCTTEELASGGRLEFAITGTSVDTGNRMIAELRIEASLAGQPATRVTVSNRLTILPSPKRPLTTVRMPLDAIVVSPSE